MAVRILTVAFLVASTAAHPVTSAGSEWPVTQSNGSWALGLVIPDGAPLSDGTKADWGTTTNLTVVVGLPSIGQVDDTVYAILSAMDRSGSILQVAAGIYPGMDSWAAYVLYLRDASSQSYSWVANESLPSMAPGANVSLSVFWEQGAWSYSVVDLGTGEGSNGTIVKDDSGGFRGGEQESIALESYTSTNSVFAGMGSMKVYYVLLDGAQVTGGWYVLGGWDPQHSPLFIVGGHEPPSFATLVSDGYPMVWSYSAEGHVAYVTSSSTAAGAFVGATAAIAATVLALDVWQRKKRKDRTVH